MSDLDEMSIDGAEGEGIGLPLDDCFDSERFLPQMDFQVVGPAWTQLREEANLTIGKLPPALSPADPLMAAYYCDACQVTWLRGVNGDNNKHPSHNAVERDTAGYGRPLRSLVVCLGASVNEDEDQAKYSVFFGAASKHNIVEDLPDAGPEASEADAHTAAGLRALEIVKDAVLPEFQQLLLREGIRGELDDPEVYFRVLLATDSEFLVDNICDTFSDTTKLSHETLDKYDEVYGDLEEAGVDLQWYLIPAENNTEANALADSEE